MGQQGGEPFFALEQRPVTTRVAIYARVSTGEQSPEAQLRVYAEHRGFHISREYVDQTSGDVRKRRRAP